MPDICVKLAFNLFLASDHMEPNFLTFESFPATLNDIKLLLM